MAQTEIDPYQALGIGRDASAEDIKAAYRRVARACHPDVTGGDPDKAERFRQATAAYELLSDPTRRTLYDLLMGSGPSRSGGGGGGGGGKDKNQGQGAAKNQGQGAAKNQGGTDKDKGQGQGGQRSGPTYHPGGIPGTGGMHRAAGIYGAGPMPGRVQDPRRDRGADGQGADNRGAEGRARGNPPAAGSSVQGASSDARGRPAEGSGERGSPGSPGIAGPRMRGEISLTLGEALLGTDKTMTLDLPDGSERELTLHVPAGIREGQVLRLVIPGAGPRGGSGELAMTVHIEPDERFRTKGADLEVDVPLPFTTALLGGTVEVPTLEPAGATAVRVPPGTSSGRRLRLAGLGPPDGDGGRRGDLYGVVLITVPQQLDDESRELVERLARRLGA